MNKTVAQSLAHKSDACAVSVESSFLSLLVQAKGPVSVYLRNGVRLKGRLVGIDEKVLFLQGEDKLIQAILTDAVSTVAPILNP